MRQDAIATETPHLGQVHMDQNSGITDGNATREQSLTFITERTLRRLRSGKFETGPIHV